MPAITLERVSKRFAGGHAVVRDLDLDIHDGELLVLVGPSGSGKSTLLRLIAGLESPTSGVIRIGNRDVTDVPPADRDLAMVFQNYALYPHQRVRENLAFGLRMRGVSPDRIAARVAEVAAALGLEELLERKPAALSGGQRQRVALGRAIVREPQAFLLDEPLSNLDPLRRVATRAELALLHRRLQTTMVYVTHDQEEAMTLGTRVAVLRDGGLEQVAPPRELYDRPATAFVARFIGSPAINLWPGAVNAAGQLALEGMPGARPIEASKRRGEVPAQLLIGVRPHDLSLAPEGEGAMRGQVAIVEPLGPTTIVHVAMDSVADHVRVVVPGDAGVAIGDRLWLDVNVKRVHLFDRATGQRLGGI